MLKRWHQRKIRIAPIVKKMVEYSLVSGCSGIVDWRWTIEVPVWRRSPNRR
jgi:hypothetical protein